MSNKIDDGGPAFPEIRTEDQGYPQSIGGMSLRDYFAAMALQALAPKYERASGPYCRNITDDCYRLADAMLAARKARTK